MPRAVVSAARHALSVVTVNVKGLHHVNAQNPCAVSDACRRRFGPIRDPTRRCSRALHPLRDGDNAGGLGTEAAGANRQFAQYEFGDLYGIDSPCCTVAAGAQALTQSTGGISRLHSMNVRASRRASSGHFSRRTTRTEAHQTFAGIRHVGDRLFVQKPTSYPQARGATAIEMALIACMDLAGRVKAAA